MTIPPLVEHYIIARDGDPPSRPLSRRRSGAGLAVGASPRASIALDKCARAYAWLAQIHVLPDDVRHGAQRTPPLYPQL